MSSYQQQKIFQGYYGKLPARGDFVGKGLPRSFIDPWDTWSRTAMYAGKQQLGNTWLNSYLTSPPYWYVLSPHNCGEQIWMGVVIPSVDSVGRYFPLTLCRTASISANPLLLFKQHSQWFSDAERLLISCLQDGFQLENFEQDLQHLSLDESGTVMQASLQHYEHSAWRVAANSLDHRMNAYPILLEDVLKSFCMAYSVWKTEGSQHIPASLLVSQGLPPFAGIASMLDGDWQNAGWLSVRETL